MVVTLETLHRDMQMVKNELFLLRHLMQEETELTDEASMELKKAREEMKKGNYISHEEMMAKYG